MYSDLKIAGFGGQGVMLMGQVLTYAGLEEGRQVLWIPSYGPEMRGGSANCTVAISDEEIGSPMVSNPDNLIIMNQPSLDKFEPELKPGGVMILNTSMITREPQRTDIKVIKVPATEIAKELGNPKVANMVILGAYLKVRPWVKKETVIEILKEKVLKEKSHLVQVNLDALERGEKAAGN